MLPTGREPICQGAIVMGFVSLLGVVALIAGVVVVQMLRSALASPFPARTRLAGVMRMQPPASSLFGDSEALLAPLGFSPLGWVVVQREPEGTPGPRLMRLYLSEDRTVLAKVIAPFSAHEPHHCRIHFASQTGGGRLLFTAPWMLQPLSADPDICITQLVNEPSLDARLRAHHELLRSQAGTTPPWTDLAATVARLQDYEEAVLASGLKRGELKPHADGGLRLSLRRALSLLGSVTASAGQAKAPDNDGTVPIARSVSYWRHQRELERHSPRSIVQWGFYLLSALGFAALGAWFWSPGFALLLLAVIAFHEAGHWMAMRAFGYRNVQMLMLPMVGGVTIGHEQSPSAPARAWVSLLGPLPGVVLGCLLLLTGSTMADGWVLLSGLVLLAINLFNLLPILPLDGGHLLHVLLPERAISLRKVFDVLAIAALAALAWQLDAWWLLLLALVPYGNLRNATRDHRLLSALRQARTDTPPRSEAAEMEQALTVVRDDAAAPPALTAQFSLAEQALTQARAVPMSRRNVVLITTLWIGSFVAAAAIPMVRDVVKAFVAPSHSTPALQYGYAKATAEARQLSNDALLSSLIAKLGEGETRESGTSAAVMADLAGLEREVGHGLHPLWRQLLLSGDAATLREHLGILPAGDLHALAGRPDCLAQLTSHAPSSAFAEGKPVRFQTFDAHTGAAGERLLDRGQLASWLVPGECQDEGRLRLVEVSDPDWPIWTLSLDPPIAILQGDLRAHMEALHAVLGLESSYPVE